MNSTQLLSNLTLDNAIEFSHAASNNYDILLAFSMDQFSAFLAFAVPKSIYFAVAMLVLAFAVDVWKALPVNNPSIFEQLAENRADKQVAVPESREPDQKAEQKAEIEPLSEQTQPNASTRKRNRSIKSKQTRIFSESHASSANNKPDLPQPANPPSETPNRPSS